MTAVPGRRERERGLLRNGVFTGTILTFTRSWSEFLVASTFHFDERTRPVTFVIPNFATVYTVDYEVRAAVAVKG